MNTDILAFGAHPDDVEISSGGIILRHVSIGCRVVLADLTRGELGTRGTKDIRNAESEEAARRLGIYAREKLDLADGFFLHNEAALREVIRCIRSYQPRIILCNAPTDRHPDHGKGSKLVLEAAFLSGLPKIETGQPSWRPFAIYHYIQDYHLQPQLIVDVTHVWTQKMNVLKSYASQFFDPDSQEPETPISSESFWHFLEGRARDMGRLIQVPFGEGLIPARPPGIADLRSLI